jgi:hypothetical protein
VSCGGRKKVRKLSGTQGIHRGRALQQAQPFGLADRFKRHILDSLEEVKKRSKEKRKKS